MQVVFGRVLDGMDIVEYIGKCRGLLSPSQV